MEIDAKVVKALIRQLWGLNEGDARRLIRQLLADGIIGEEDLPAVAQAKYRLLARGRLLHFEMEPLDPDGLAGMRRLKRWLALRKAAFLREPGSERLDPPRGVLRLGVQRAGKSSAARLAAAMFRVPLLRMDIAALYDKYHRERERRLHEALAQAEQMAPCVRGIDEIKKALATRDADGGVSRRVLGLLLTWMAERKKPVFLFATANAVHELPPELLRKGRFDEVFFVACRMPRRGRRSSAFIWRGAVSIRRLSTSQRRPRRARAFPGRRSSRRWSVRSMPRMPSAAVPIRRCSSRSSPGRDRCRC